VYFSNASHYDIQERLKLSGPTVRLDVIAQSHLTEQSHDLSTTLCTRCGMLCSVPSDYQLVLFVVLEKNLSIFLITFCKAFGPKNKANETMC